MIVKNIILGFNFSELIDDAIDLSLTPYEIHLSYLLWAIVFSACIGITYRVTKDLGSVTAVIFLIFGLFGTTNSFINSPELSFWFFWVAVAGYAGCVLSLFIKKRHEN